MPDIKTNTCRGLKEKPLLLPTDLCLFYELKLDFHGNSCLLLKVEFIWPWVETSGPLAL